jgi:hypothetical protein
MIGIRLTPTQPARRSTSSSDGMNPWLRRLHLVLTIGGGFAGLAVAFTTMGESFRQSLLDGLLRSLALRPAHSRRHQFVTSISRRLQPFRYLHSCSGSFRLEHLPGGAFTHWKTPPLHGAHPLLPVVSVGFAESD